MTFRPGSRAKAFQQRFLSSGEMAPPPDLPGVYWFMDGSGSPIYVGKAISLRRRLGQYANVRRLRKHRRMRRIVEQASSLEFLVTPSHLEACLEEERRIRELRPRLNIAGAFSFLYPMVGVRWDGPRLWIVGTTRPERIEGYEWFGAFRSREMTFEALEALFDLLSYVAVPVPRAALFAPGAPSRLDRASVSAAFTGLPEGWRRLLTEFLRGTSLGAMSELVLALADSAAARRRAKRVQRSLDALKRFYRFETDRLRLAMAQVGQVKYPIPQNERDALFLRARHGKGEAVRNSRPGKRAAPPEASPS